MPKAIEVSDATHARLTGLMSESDTSETVIVRLLDSFASRRASRRVPRPGDNAGGDKPPKLKHEHAADLEFVGLEVPDLTHTRVLVAFIDGQEVLPPKWNRLRTSSVVRAVKEHGAGAIANVPGVTKGRKIDNGFTFFPDADVSIQGQDANDAWRSVVEVSRKVGWRIEVSCEWRNKAGAAYPGKSAILMSHS